MLRKVKVFFSCLFILFMFASAVVANETVWITASGKGKKYHYENCRTLSRSAKKQISMSEARRLGYTGCSVCDR